MHERKEFLNLPLWLFFYLVAKQAFKIHKYIILLEVPTTYCFHNNLDYFCKQNDWHICIYKCMLQHYIIKQTYRAKHKCASDTPGSCPARTAKNPVVPTTVKRKAACTIKDFCYLFVKNVYNLQETYVFKIESLIRNY